MDNIELNFELMHVAHMQTPLILILIHSYTEKNKRKSSNLKLSYVNAIKLNIATRSLVYTRFQIKLDKNLRNQLVM